MKALSIQIKCSFGTGKQMLPPSICSTRVGGKECRKNIFLCYGILLLAPPHFRQNPALEHSSGLVCVQGAENAAAASLGTASYLPFLFETASLLTALSPEIQEEFVVALLRLKDDFWVMN